VSNDHVHAHLRGILDNIANTHRYARQELREGAAAIDRVNGVKMPKPLAYDSQCEALAEIFLDAHNAHGKPFSQAEAQDLAQTIQNAIEDWFYFRDNPARGEDAQ
jgi:hypothetical protein